MDVTVDGTDNYVIGVDYGTLSGPGRGGPGPRRQGTRQRCLRLPARRGHRRTSGRCGGRSGRSSRPPSRRMGTSGAERLPRRPPPRRAGGDRRRRDRPGRRGRNRHRLHRLHHGAGQGRRHPAERTARLRQPAARLREAVAPPRRAAAGGPDQRPGRGARRDLAAALRRADLLRMGIRQGPAAAGGGPGSLRRHGPLGGGRRLDRLAAVRQLRPQRLHRRLQGHLPGRPLPVRGLPGRAEPGVQGLRQHQAGRTPSAGSATPPAT